MILFPKEAAGFDRKTAVLFFAQNALILKGF